MDERFAHIDERFVALKESIEERFNQIDRRFEEVNQGFDKLNSTLKWAFGLFAGLLVVIIVGTLAIIIKVLFAGKLTP
jgi:hypothetical protein